MKFLHLSLEWSMQKCAVQDTNIKEGNFNYLLQFHALGDHWTESCVWEVVSHKCLKFQNCWWVVLCIGCYENLVFVVAFRYLL